MQQKQKRYRVLVLVLTIVILACLALLVYCVQTYRYADNAYANIGGDMSSDNLLPPSEAHKPSEEKTEISSFVVSPLSRDAIVTLQSENEQFACMLTCPETTLNYPVVQGNDNAYYLTHLFSGEENPAGCLFIDYFCKEDFTSDNTIIYGHNMKNGSMFATLVAYKDPTFFAAHPVMQLQTADTVYALELIAGYSPADDFDAWQIEFDDEATFYAFLAEARAASTFQSDIIVTADDRLVTLSTCSYEAQDARYVLLGRLAAMDA